MKYYCIGIVRNHIIKFKKEGVKWLCANQASAKLGREQTRKDRLRWGDKQQEPLSACILCSRPHFGHYEVPKWGVRIFSHCLLRIFRIRERFGSKCPLYFYELINENVAWLAGEI